MDASGGRWRRSAPLTDAVWQLLIKTRSRPQHPIIEWRRLLDGIPRKRNTLKLTPPLLRRSGAFRDSGVAAEIKSKQGKKHFHRRGHRSFMAPGEMNYVWWSKFLIISPSFLFWVMLHSSNHLIMNPSPIYIFTFYV